jgi:anti-sigma B factor antagonist
MASTGASHLDIKKSEGSEEESKVTTIRCPGRLVAENAEWMKEKVSPLIPLGEKLVVDMSELEYLDSAGLGALLSLKVSSMKQKGTLQFVNITPRVLELLRVTHLEKIFSS